MKLDDLPLDQFEMLGVSKADLINLPPRTLNALLNGQRTSLMRFKNVTIGGVEQPITLDAKLSIEIKPNGNPTLKIHPINKAAKNTFGLNADEVAFLEKDSSNFVNRKIKGIDGSLKDVMIYLDKITNEYIAINKTSINAPEAINNVKLTPEQKEDFKSGNPIKINGESYRINPNSEIGLSSTDGNDLKISRIQFKHSSYSKNELALDLALFASAPGGIILLEHIANIALYTAADRIKNHDTLSNISDSRYWEAINNASKEIKNLQEEQKFDPNVIARIINKHLEQTGIIHIVEEKDLHLETGHKEEKIGLS